jgi:cyclophilin family peptidyl-prolyl cis-trans isomerase
MKKILISALGLLTIGLLIWLLQPAAMVTSENQASETATNTTNQSSAMTATIKTNKGDIDVAFFEDSAPKTVENFQKLAADDFYQGVIFHRVIEGFMIQGGDPTGTGTGGPGYTFADELDPDSAAAKRGYKRGTLAMANSGPNSNGSQFFIMHEDKPLPYNYTIFGYVTDGMDVVDLIAMVETAPGDKPRTDVVIEDVVIDTP